MRFLPVAVLATLFLFSNAQTTQTTTDGSGSLIIQVVSTNAAGIPITTAIQTLSASPTPVSSTSSDPVGVLGPKNGQPVSQTGSPGAPTPYFYTTVIDGQTQVFLATFTPTSPQTINFTATSQGTILPYSSWLAVYGPPTGSAQSSGMALRPALVGLGMTTAAMITYFL
ncbi:hypothetical protein JR316_0006043 [Psilocybe cubensis]|uniref:Uncharacterized protein n=2 Tax=Psilocybe cubensis TaxID=181762 RepID=A0A8H8CMR0_PSICU|nr:hypothetical protein JR316_0006043 [Psilocybe cubensis]KAH9481516.1 hypothetical protein JR316_0006043 [Psilocybe cubensis]